MTVPRFLVMMITVVLLTPVDAVADPPNFVWIIADDMSPDTGAYGLTQVRTPNLDRLAAQGRRFDRAYASSPVCSPSRSAFILGCYQTKTGLHPHDVENPQPLPAPYMPVTQILRDSGWYVTNAAAPREPGSPSKETMKPGKTHYNFAHQARNMFDGADWRDREPGQPFFAQFQIKEPHRPFPIPDSFDEASLAEIRLPASYPDDPLIRRDWYAYHRSVEVVDQRVGLILDQLEAEGVLDQTILFFFADHGRPMPWGKQWLSVEGLHVPLIVRGPSIEAGVESRLVSLIDLAPSLLKLAAIDMPDWIDGEPLFAGEPSTRSTIFAARDRCGDAMDRIRAIITDKDLLVRNFTPGVTRLNWSSYKESQYPAMPLLRRMHLQHQLSPIASEWLGDDRPTWEFYDLASDPEGVNNIASDPASRQAVATLGATLDNWIDQSDDQGVTGDPPTEPPLKEIQRAKRADYERAWKKRLGTNETTDQQRLDWWRTAYRL